MAFCERCGAYIPIGETACPACGFDPEAEARREREERERAEAEEKRRREEAEAEERRRKQQAEAEARRKQQQEEARKRAQQEEARRRAQQEEARRRAEENRKKAQYQSQYASQSAQQTWAPPWNETTNHGHTQQQSSQQSYQQAYQQSYQQAKPNYAQYQNSAADSVAHQKLSILSYIGPLWLIPLFTRKDDSFARYHVGQGINLTLFNLALNAIGGILSGGVGELLIAAGGLFRIFCMVKGILNVSQGKKEPLPLIGNWKIFR